MKALSPASHPTSLNVCSLNYSTWTTVVQRICSLFWKIAVMSKSSQLCVFTAPPPEGLLSVVHITDDGMNFLEPLEVTDTHVVVTVSHFSALGIVKNFIKWVLKKTKTVCGKVLLFLGQPNPKTQRRKLDVFLLPWNIHQDVVKLCVTAVSPNCLNVIFPLLKCSDVSSGEHTAATFREHPGPFKM